MAKKAGYKVQVINFREMSVGNNYNPLYVPYTIYKKGKIDDAIELVENVGYNILSDFNQTDADPFWENSAINLFTGLTLYLFDKAKPEEININSVVNLSYKLDEISNELTDKSSIIYTYLSSIIDAPKETKGSILAVFKQKMGLITSRDGITKLMCNNNLDLEHIKTDKTAIFVISDGKFSSIVMPMILDQVYNLVRLNHHVERRLNIILDEFGTIKPIKNFL
jgi:type IV secretory pathway TraG/TraD family ATPase VirD4